MQTLFNVFRKDDDHFKQKSSADQHKKQGSYKGSQQGKNSRWEAGRYANTNGSPKEERNKKKQTNKKHIKHNKTNKAL